ncbi:unnamed protein product [Peronospora belbahrii]|uniref:Uncharacterized protein n=1 Tax=Peronospora belbahrii TaxID=622444 RepID=A0ABN8D633_9STRA|nr:unnamed protein product [Peronospora belbahrii]
MVIVDPTTVMMEVLKTTVVTEKAAAKLLKKFVDNKKDEENADLMMNEEVRHQLAQVLAHLEENRLVFCASCLCDEVILKVLAAVEALMIPRRNAKDLTMFTGFLISIPRRWLDCLKFSSARAAFDQDWQKALIKIRHTQCIDIICYIQSLRACSDHKLGSLVEHIRHTHCTSMCNIGNVRTVTLKRERTDNAAVYSERTRHPV